MIYVHLSRLLGERRMPQSELAKLTGIRPNTISELYNGIADRINFDHLDLICEALDCDLGELIERKPNDMKRTGKDLIIEPYGKSKGQ